MSRYIDAESLIEAWCKEVDIEPDDRGAAFIGYQQIIRLINEAPTVDVEPIKHGEWEVTDAYPHNVYCSECHKTYAQTHWQVWTDKEKPLPRNYCPNCGAKMDKK